MRRPASERFCQISHVDPVALLKCCLANLMLLDVMRPAKTDGPAVGRFDRETPVGVATDMRALDRALEAAGDATVMPPDPGPVRRAFTADSGPCRNAFEPVW